MSPRPGPPRPLIALRLGENGLAKIDERAQARGVNRSEMMRLLLEYGCQRMPRDWNPAGQIDSKGKQK